MHMNSRNKMMHLFGCENNRVRFVSGVRSVTALWVHSDGSSLWIRWERDVTAVNASEFAIEWSAETNPDRKHWQRVDGSAFTARLTGQSVHKTILMSQTCPTHLIRQSK